MTVHSKVKKALTDLESAKSAIQGFAQDTEEKEAKQMYQQMAQTMETQCQQLKNRLEYIESEEPQFTQGS